MDLITLYNYQYIRNTDIKRDSLADMRNKGDWELDERGNDTISILRKRFVLKDGSIYKVLLRFSQSNAYKSLYTLDQPIPFVIIQSQQLESGAGYKDIQIFHGRKIKNVLGYMKLGIPVELFDLISNDLKDYLIYQNEEQNEMLYNGVTYHEI